MPNQIAASQPWPMQPASAPGRRPDDPARVRDAAQQFEALLLSQLLRSVRESGGGWMGSGQDAAGDCATEFAEQQLSVVLARSGGLGLAGLIESGLREQEPRAGEPNAEPRAREPAL